MKESYREGVAIHSGPESCACTRKGVGEALTGVDTGSVLSREIDESLRGADVVQWIEGNTQCLDKRERQGDPARSKARYTYRNTMHGSREIPHFSVASKEAERMGKSQDVRP